MKTYLFAAASCLAIGIAAAPASAQSAPHHDHMPGMQMPAPETPDSEPPASAPTDHQHMPGMQMPAPETPDPQPPASAPTEHQHMPGMQMPPSGSAASDEHANHDGHGMAMGAFGAYPMTRESSGTAWQPDASEHMGLMSQTGEWTLMAHGVLNLVYDHQAGPRGDDKLFTSGMLMGMARRPVGNGTMQFRAMISPDPVMGKRGYPLLLASGETANGVDRLIDRQHPHDFFMELSGSLSQNFGSNRSVFLYAGLPGEPAFGPPAFMHREAIMDSPEAPISHHWLDSTHITFGVLTAGVVLGRLKVEASRFNAREPDQHRWNIETGALDSTSVRLSWNPTQTLSLQGSWGHFEDPEQLEPGIDQKRWSASLLYAREIGDGWKLASTIAWGRKTVSHHGEALKDDAFVAEASLKKGPWTVFGRGETTENRELLEADEHGAAFDVGKISLGAVRDFRVAEHVSLGAGALVAVNFVPEGLAPLYGGNNPVGAMGFFRLKLD